VKPRSGRPMVARTGSRPVDDTAGRKPWSRRLPVVLTRLDLRAARPDRAALQGLLPRAALDVAAAVAAVEPIVTDVRLRGADAIVDAARRFDGVDRADLRVEPAEIKSALDTLDPPVRAALEVAIERVRLVHADQRRSDTTTKVV